MRVITGRGVIALFFYRMVEQFVEFHGKGIIKKLILDRGFWTVADLADASSNGGLTC